MNMQQSKVARLEQENTEFEENESLARIYDEEERTNRLNEMELEELRRQVCLTTRIFF